jgi:hypothetical protein
MQYKSVYEKCYEIKSTPCIMHQSPYQWNIVKKTNEQNHGRSRSRLILAYNILPAKMKTELEAFIHDNLNQ